MVGTAAGERNGARLVETSGSEAAEEHRKPAEPAVPALCGTCRQQRPGTVREHNQPADKHASAGPLYAQVGSPV